jgi:RNA ligase (TIGR02306 family)
MSTLVVPVTLIEAITPHPDADALELAQVLGWQIVVKKHEYQVADKIVYFPIDTVLPLETSERFGVTKYLSKQRIRCARLRGEPSFGLVVRPDDENWEVGRNVAEHYGAQKYEPPIRVGQGDAEVAHPLFWEYTEIENMRNYPDIFTVGETVVLTEKIHGTNSRVGSIQGEFMGGSKALQRKRPAEDNFAANIYWSPLALPSVRALLEDLGKEHAQVILFGEVYGSKIQSLHYGYKGRLGFRSFDLLIDGRYQNWPDLVMLAEKYGIETVPVVATIPFELAEVKRLSEGPTLLMQQDAHIREGVVVRPLVERIHPKVGRVIQKYVSDSYLFGKNTDYTDR